MVMDGKRANMVAMDKMTLGGKGSAQVWMGWVITARE